MSTTIVTGSGRRRGRRPARVPAAVPEWTVLAAPTPKPGQQALRIAISRAGCACGSEVFLQPEVVIGRRPGSDLHLLCAMVSGTHAVVRILEQRVLIEDAGSKNGVRVNGCPVARCALLPGDRVRLGTFELRCELLSDRGPSLDACLWDEEDTLRQSA